jgi:CubicO group peptidase (beta-lactamase class C family)
MKKILPLLVLIASALTACTQQYSPEIENKIKQVEQNLGPDILITGRPRPTLQERMAFYHLKGLSIAVVHNYKIEWARGYGWADSAEQRPVTAQTLFQAASISKSLNAVGVLRLAQEGKLDLYADINNYLTGWKFPYDSLSKGRKITVANLLSHTGGLTVHGFPGYAVGDSLPTVGQILDGKSPANSPAVRSMSEPGLRSEYSGGGITISQLIVMDITHVPYDRYMHDNVLMPLGMTSSFYTQPAPADKRQLLATGYQMNGKAIEGKYHIYPEEAAAGLWTNPTDLCKYIIETELSYAGKSAKVLDGKHTRLRLTPYVDSSAALGVFIDNVHGDHYFQHGGSNNGFRCQYFGLVDGGEGVAVMVNSDNGAILPELINSVATVYNWKRYYEPQTKTTAAVEPAQLQACEGKYKSHDEKLQLFLVIKAEKDRLVLTPQWTGQQIVLLPESATNFFNADFGMTAKLIKGPDGSVTSVTINDKDIWDKLPQ